MPDDDLPDEPGWYWVEWHADDDPKLLWLNEYGWSKAKQNEVGHELPEDGEVLGPVLGPDAADRLDAAETFAEGWHLNEDGECTTHGGREEASENLKRLRRLQGQLHPLSEYDEGALRESGGGDDAE